MSYLEQLPWSAVAALLSVSQVWLYGHYFPARLTTSFVPL